MRPTNQVVSNPNIRFCKDCEYYSGEWREGWMSPPPGWPLCYAKVSYLDLVYGTNHYESCIVARATFCGPEAKCFKPLEPKPQKLNFFQKLFK